MSRISGNSLLSAFDQEVFRRDTARSWVESRIAVEEKKIARANADRESAYTELAELYAADQGKLAASFGEISQRLQSIFDEKRRRRGEVNGLIDQAADLIAKLHAQLPPAQEAEHGSQRRLDETMRAVDAELKQDAAFLALSREAAELTAALEQSKDAHARIRSECETKLAAFHANRLFRYLVTVKFGTADYTRRGAIASGDRWLARQVRWEQNRPAFATLTELPAFAQSRVADAQKRAELAGTKIAFYIHEREVAQGVDTARAGLAAASQALSQLQAQIAKLEHQRGELAKERQSIDGSADPFQKRAKAEMKAFLLTHPIAALKAKAAATADVRDDQCVARIERAENEVNEGRKQVKALLVERTEAQVQHQRAVGARRKFSHDYTGTYDQFNSGFDFNNLLTGYIMGSTSERSLWSSFDQHHYDVTPQHTYSSSSDSTSSGFGGFSGGGDSASSFSGGGGDSGGGFSTGGGD